MPSMIENSLRAIPNTIRALVGSDSQVNAAPISQWSVYDPGSPEYAQDLKRRNGGLIPGRDDAQIQSYREQIMGGGLSAEEANILIGRNPSAAGVFKSALQNKGFIDNLGRDQSGRFSVQGAVAQALESGRPDLAAKYSAFIPKEKERRTFKGADGFNYYEGGERVLPGVVKSEKPSVDKGLLSLRVGGIRTGDKYHDALSPEQASRALKTMSSPLVSISGNDPLDTPYSLSDLEKIVDSKTGKSPKIGLTPREVRENPSLFRMREKPVSGETAGRQAMLSVAKKQIPLINSLLFNKDGSVNREGIAKMRLFPGGVPGTSGRKLAVAMEVGIQAITRTETGATMPSGEVENTRKRFQPSLLDDDETIKLKMEMFSDFLSGGLKLLDPDGRFNDDLFEQELSARKAELADIKEMPAPQGVDPRVWENIPAEDRKLWLQ